MFLLLAHNLRNLHCILLSCMHLQPSKEDDYTDLSCEARHEALLKEYPLRTTVQLSVMCK
jgi:hypothetical protein